MTTSIDQRALLEQRALLHAAIAKFDFRAEVDSNDPEHAAAVDMREEAVGLLSATLPFIDMQALLEQMRHVADEMMLPSHKARTQAAYSLRGLFLDMDALYCDGVLVASDWEAATATAEDLCRDGDPDPTPENLTVQEECGERSPDEVFTCTRRSGHVGRQHVAGNGSGHVAATWPWRSRGGAS